MAAFAATCRVAAGLAFLSCSAASAQETSLPARGCSAGGAEFTIAVAGISRRDILAEICGENAVIEWRDKTVADQLINGRFRGTAGEILAGVLGRANFSIAYENDGEELRITRILVFSSRSPVIAGNPTLVPAKTTLVRKRFSLLQHAAKTELFQKRLRAGMEEKLRAAKAIAAQRESHLEVKPLQDSF